MLPSELSISVQEEPAASAILWEGQYVVLGASGKVLELAAAAPENCPVVKGVALQQAEPVPPLPLRTRRQAPSCSG